MLHTPRARRGMVTSPHHLASEAGLRVLRDGGNAVEAAVAMGAALSVVYPQMTGLGGDGFWLVAEPGRDPVAIEGCGAAGSLATLERYGGLDAVPWRGPLAANTVAGAVSGWAKALEVAGPWGRPLGLPRLLEDAIHHARHGYAVTGSQAELTEQKLDQLKPVPGFAETFLIGGVPPKEGDILRLSGLAATLEHLARSGLDDFYRGEIGAALAEDLARAGAPIIKADIEGHQAQMRQPLSVSVKAGRLFNFPPPTQGLASLILLAVFDRLGVAEAEGFDHIHGLIEATKAAFRIRDRAVQDPSRMTEPAETFLKPGLLDELAAGIDRAHASSWTKPASDGDTVWLGAIDGEGRAVSYIQSIYFEFGSGLVLPQTGIVWQNRGCSFRLSDRGWNCLAPGRKPFHTLNPAYARLADGRTMVYGTMGGEGQPQTQAAIFTRYAMYGQSLQQAVTAPRWLLGRSWGEESLSLRMEDRFPSGLIDQLNAAGHAAQLVEPFTGLMGHAGAIVRRPDGWCEGASDPRSDGAAIGF